MMEWNRIEQKWLDMTVRLQAGTRLPKADSPDAIAADQKDAGLKSGIDQSLARNDTNARMIA